MATVYKHLSVELEERYVGISRMRRRRGILQVIWLLARGHTIFASIGDDGVWRTMDGTIARPL